MIYNEDAYYTGYARNVRTFGGGSKGAYAALVFDTIAGLIRDKGIGEIANSTLLEMLGGTKPTLLAAIDLIISTGYLEKKCGDGRGNKSIYYITEKGKENCPFMNEKGSKIFTKRVKNFYEKGKEICPLNKELNKELKESGDDVREAQSHALSTTTKNLKTMEDFNLFWDQYPGDPEWSWRKEDCERVWYAMQTNWRDNIVQMLQNGIRWRKRDKDDPYWYLKDYHGQIIHGELPYVTQGTQKFGQWIENAKRNGIEVVMVRYEDKLRHCHKIDLPTMIAAGAEYIGEFKQ